MPNEGRRGNDLILTPHSYAHIWDETKGTILTYVGPHAAGLTDTDRPVVFDENQKTFNRASVNDAIKMFPTAPEGWYIILKNPAKDNTHPRQGKNDAADTKDLNVGRKVNIPGPAAFPLWPGQMFKVLKGHHLRTNQYLLIRVYDDQVARDNWAKSVIKTAKGEEGAPEYLIDPEELNNGRIFVIKGTDVSFYIPPSGVEVVPDHEGHYVRNACTLERLEYCILKDEDGNKRYMRGPDVIFPKATERFIRSGKSIKFRAIELNELSGIHIKVIAPYSEGDRSYKEGEELFITGEDTKIYFPREEHAIIRYGEGGYVHTAVAVAAGNGRYVMNRLTGEIKIVKGPAMLLPDPRVEVVVRRVLDGKQVETWFPGNSEALEYNKALARSAASQTESYVADFSNVAPEETLEVPEDGVLDSMDSPTSGTKGGPIGTQALYSANINYDPGAYLQEAYASPRGFAPSSKMSASKKRKKRDSIRFEGEQFDRDEDFQTSGRSIILDQKYEGVVRIDVWNGYAVQIVSTSGGRKVVAGPATELLPYDSVLDVIQLSTGMPKSDAQTIKTPYLRVLNNRVSDVVEVETSDPCKIDIKLAYRVNFIDDESKWFNVEDYVKFLTEHMRSIIRNQVKKIGIEQFYPNAIDTLRDIILGKSKAEGNGNEPGRSGKLFPENNMSISDVEILDVNIKNGQIAAALVNAGQHSVQERLQMETHLKHYEVVCKLEEINQKLQAEKVATLLHNLELQRTEEDTKYGLETAKKNNALALSQLDIDREWKDFESKLSQQKAEMDQKAEFAQRELEMRLTTLQKEAEALKEKAQAVTPQMVAALQSFGDKEFVGKISESMSPLAILGGKSVMDVLSGLLSGTNFDSLLSVRNRMVGAELGTGEKGQGKSKK